MVRLYARCDRCGRIGAYAVDRRRRLRLLGCRECGGRLRRVTEAEYRARLEYTMAHGEEEAAARAQRVLAFLDAKRERRDAQRRQILGPRIASTLRSIEEGYRRPDPLDI